MEELQEQIKEDEEYKMLTLSADIICGDHEFFHTTGSEIKCKKCPLGYLVGPEISLHDGKIYLHGDKLSL